MKGMDRQKQQPEVVWLDLTTLKLGMLEAFFHIQKWSWLTFQKWITFLLMSQILEEKFVLEDQTILQDTSSSMKRQKKQ